MRYLYSQETYSREIWTGDVKSIIFKPVKVKRPISFSNKRLLNESFTKYKSRLVYIKIYIKAMKNGIKVLNCKRVVNV